jgi:hypothetical protein
MLGAPLLLVLALAAGASDVKNPALAEGIRLYDALDYAGALQSLTQALDRPSSKKDSARIHLYIGLIQHRYKLKDDAEASFIKALDYDAKVKLPKNATALARTFFKKLQKAKTGRSDDDPPEPKLEEAKKKRPKPKRGGEDDTDNAGIEYIASSKSESATSTRATARENGEPREANGALAMAEPTHSAVPNTSELPRVDPQSTAPRDPTTAVSPSYGAVPPGESSSGPIVGWVAVGVGVAAVAAGVTLAALAGKNGSDSMSEPIASRAEDLYGTAVQQRTFAIVSFGVSGAALGLAAVLFLTD